MININKQKNLKNMDFKVKTSNGLTVKINCKNATEAQAVTLDLLQNDGDFLELTSGFVNILRTTKDSGSSHHNHNGFRFDGYPFVDRASVSDSLFY